MPKTFTLVAVPEMVYGRDHRKHLEYVNFIATSGTTTYKWFATNMGTYEDDFAQIVTSDEARSIVQRLRHGETVSFSGVFDYDELRSHDWGGASNK
jgi:hypothetical protein